MSEETCGDCGRLLVGTLDELWKSPSYNCVRYDADLLDDGDEDTMIARANCREFTIANLRSQLSAATARASELERECEAMKALLTLAGQPDCCAYTLGTDSWFAQVEELHSAETAVELAINLGLIAPDGKGETSGC